MSPAHLKTLSVLTLLLLAGPAAAQEVTPRVVTGPASVVDADILMIGEHRIILWGLDAPQAGQSCTVNGRRWGCYDVAFRTLQTLVDQREVSCRLVGEPDQFGSHYGVCEAGGRDVNTELVRAGLAVAFVEQSEDYLPAQLEAVGAQAGLWQEGVEFREPWIWRRAMTPGGYR